jgi:hypothetical protein
LQASKRPIQLQEPRPAAYNVASASLQRQLKEMQQQLDRLKAKDHVQLPYDGNAKMYSTQAVLRVTVQRASRIGCGMTEIWLDGGSTHHMVRDKSLIFNRTASHVSSVVVAGGEEHSVECCGDILLETPKGQVIFHGVLCIPKFVVNLLSVPQLDLQGYSVVQGKEQADVYDAEGKRLLSGSLKAGLYSLDCSIAPSPVVMKSYSREEKCTWQHQKLNYGTVVWGTQACVLPGNC